MSEKKLSKKEKKKARKQLMKSYGRPVNREEWFEELLFYENHYDRRWFYHDWIKAGRPAVD
jgi:hypothetical protein